MCKVLSDLISKFRNKNKGPHTNIFISEQRGFSSVPEKGAKDPHFNLIYHYFPEEK